jgi:hypothetical protein
MTRDFSQIQTMDEAAEAIIGAKCIDFNDTVFTFESIVGERFTVQVTPEKIQVGIGQVITEFKSKVVFIFNNHND